MFLAGTSRSSLRYSRSYFGALFGHSQKPVFLSQVSNMSTGQKSNGKVPLLNMDNLNPLIKGVEYAVRGPIVIKASQIEQELKNVSFSFIPAKSNVYI